ncbi:ABC transporter G family member 4 [Gossypium arboreum]|uniref:ABC transporter G family member 4 n=1 Tax=Gossypium arboreum TaxID=29729 RepID=A0A0B0PCE2_GOSAR|nr:ABC transporter G family member 4 [Gossypium arboreum]
MWGYLPGPLPQRAPLVSPVLVPIPDSIDHSWTDVCGGGCGFAMAISDNFFYVITSVKLTLYSTNGGFLCKPHTIHSEVAQCLLLPSLPVFCGASDLELRLFDDPAVGASRSLNRKQIKAQASRIANLLRKTDVSYL